jgi:hypothetical protein
MNTETWNCRRCGQSNTLEFDICWNCHQERGVDTTSPPNSSAEELAAVAGMRSATIEDLKKRTAASAIALAIGVLGFVALAISKHYVFAFLFAGVAIVALVAWVFGSLFGSGKIAGPCPYCRHEVHSRRFLVAGLPRL